MARTQQAIAWGVPSRRRARWKEMPRKFKMLLPDGKNIEASLAKFTRGDIYGVKRRERRDVEGNPLKQARITLDGFHLIPNKGTSTQIIDEEGNFVERGSTVVATLEGEPCPLTESMFSTGVDLKATITLEEYLHHDIERTYVLESEFPLGALYEDCVARLEEGELYAFTYAWMATHDPSRAILLPVEGTIVVAVGKQVTLKWVGPDTQVLALFEDIIEDEEFEFEESW